MGCLDHQYLVHGEGGQQDQKYLEKVAFNFAVEVFSKGISHEDTLLL